MATKVGKRKNPSGEIVYRALYKTPDGDWLSAGAHPTREQAQKAATLAEAETHKADWVDPRRGKGTYNAFVEDTYLPTTKVLEKSSQDSTRYYLGTYILPVFGEKQVSEIKPSDVQRWISRWVEAETHSPATIVKAHGILHRSFTWAVRDRILAVNPCAETDLPTIPDPEVVIMTPEEYEAIFDALPGLREKALCQLASETGMRWSELMGFCPEQILIGNRIKIDRGLLEVSKRLNAGTRWIRKAYPKGKTMRTVTVSQECIDLVNQLIISEGRWCVCCPRGERTEMQREVFLAATGRHFGRTDFRRDVWKRAMKKAGLADKPYTMKHLRSSFCSWMHAAGVPSIDVQQLMGHKSGETTEKYKQTLPEAEVGAAAALQALRAARRKNAS